MNPDTCDTIFDKDHAHCLLTNCGAIVTYEATRCPLCGKRLELNAFKILEEEFENLQHQLSRTEERAGELAQENLELRLTLSAARKAIAHAEARKREVQTLQEACRKHREARRDYWRELKWRGDQIGAQNKVIASQRSSIEELSDCHNRLNVKEPWRKVPAGTMSAYLECSECCGPFELAGPVVPAHCPHCGRKIESAGRWLTADLKGDEERCN